MYNCILWAGSHLPLPKTGELHELSHNGWRPVYVSEEGVPLFWWFLLDRFNCFWLNSGVPIFVVDRTSALARAEERYNRMLEVLLPAQCEMWQDFVGCLKTCTGDIFNIQIEGFWLRRLLANSEDFDNYMKKNLLLLEGAGYGSREQQERKKSLMAECVGQIGLSSIGLCGEKTMFGK